MVIPFVASWAIGSREQGHSAFGAHGHVVLRPDSI